MFMFTEADMLFCLAVSSFSDVFMNRMSIYCTVKSVYVFCLRLERLMTANDSQERVGFSFVV